MWPPLWVCGFSLGTEGDVTTCLAIPMRGAWTGAVGWVVDEAGFPWAFHCSVSSGWDQRGSFWLKASALA